MNKELKDFRERYEKGKLDRSDLHANPFVQFQSYLDIAIAEEVPEPNAMTLATIGMDGSPNVRVVLLKELEKHAMVFYTNYDSQKAIDMASENLVGANFLWKKLQTQVRIKGIVEKVSREQSEKYFSSRPRKSQLGAWASAQSAVIESRVILESEMKKMEDRFENVEMIPTPDHWGGFRIIISSFEFWQGRRSRLHDRFRYQKSKDGWKIDRLAP